MASKSAKLSLKERLHKKARVSVEPKKSILKSNSAPAKLTLKTKPSKSRPLPGAKEVSKVSTAGPPRLSKDSKGKEKAANAIEDEDPEQALPTSFKIMAGSYEKLLYGLEGTVSIEGSTHKYNLKPIFIFPAHLSYIRAVAASPKGGKWLATGSGDEIIKVWDLRRRKEIGGLMHHEGSITHLSFPSRSHMLSASEDGTLCLFHARDWAVLRSLKGHKGRVNSVAVHPSGKVALSVGKDRTLRMWDLMRGKGSASTKLGKEGELVRWSTTGNLFIVQTLAVLDVYTTDMRHLHTITHTSRIHDIKFCKRVTGEGEVLLVAAEDKKVTVYDIPLDPETAPQSVAEIIGHDSRVKAVETLAIALPPIPDAPKAPLTTTLVSTISSDGKVRVFDLAALPAEVSSDGAKAQISALVEYDTKGSRLTCMAFADGDDASAMVSTDKRKRKRDEAEEEAEEIDGDEDDVEQEAEDEDENEQEGISEAEEEVEDDE